MIGLGINWEIKVKGNYGEPLKFWVLSEMCPNRAQKSWKQNDSVVKLRLGNTADLILYLEACSTHQNIEGPGVPHGKESDKLALYMSHTHMHTHTTHMVLIFMLFQ